MHNVHPIWNVLHGIEIHIKFVHPNVGRADGCFITAIVFFGVSIVDIGTAGLARWRSLPNWCGLETWADLQHLRTFKELNMIAMS
jgi:hypothetical protein